MDCANGESFGFDTFRLKENNLRIHFDDTSNSASFPSNDWRIVINDSANGGASYFAVEDSTAGTTPFRVLAGAGNNALYVDAQGDVGVGTATPAVELQVTDGDSPTLRLEQNGSSGFTAQTWDVAGNETNFFVRDATNGSKLPFRIKPGAPTDSIYVAANGDVGMGTDSPSKALHVKRSDGTAKVLIEETTSSVSSRALLELHNQGPVRIILNDVDAGKAWRLKNDNTEFKITESGGGADEFLLDENGNLTIAGTLTQNSDRDTKENFVPLNPRQILEKVAAMPVSRWNFKFDDDDVQHIGPMAQDFHAAFGLGVNERRIAPLDTSGVALAAVQGLYAILQEKSAEIARLEARLAENEVLLQAQQQQLSALETQTQRLAALEAAVATFARLQGSGNAVTTGFIAD
jgi:hypothetical protein